MRVSSGDVAQIEIVVCRHIALLTQSLVTHSVHHIADKIVLFRHNLYILLFGFYIRLPGLFYFQTMLKLLRFITYFYMHV